MGNNAINCSTLGTLPQDPACGSLTNEMIEIPGVITTVQMTLEVLTSITSYNDILLYHLQLTENSSVFLYKNMTMLYSINFLHIA